MDNNCYGLILAAGLGTRMKSELPKVLHNICGLSLLENVILNFKSSSVGEIAIITGYKQELITKKLGNEFKYYTQEKQLGTAHAVMCAREFLKGKKGQLVIACGDAPLQDGVVLDGLIRHYKENQLDLCVLSAKLSEPRSYGRIIRNGDEFIGIREAKECSKEELLINEVNSGTYVIDTEKLYSILDEFSSENAKGEYYLTDAVELFRKHGYKVGAFLSEDESIIKAANDRYELYECEQLLRNKINKEHMLNGVRLIDPNSTYIDRGVIIGFDTTIYPNTILQGNTKIGHSCEIISSRIVDSTIADECKIDTSTIEQSTVGTCVVIGPYAHLRPKTVLHDKVKIGNFVEVKNATMQTGSKSSHLTYVGDTDIGRDVNIGCGVVFVNYDGKNKFRSVVEDDAFIGCNANIIAPLTIGKNAVIAAGSTVVSDVGADALLISRCRETVKENYKKK